LPAMAILFSAIPVFYIWRGLKSARLDAKEKARTT
jgi:hypothetical protein